MKKSTIALAAILALLLIGGCRQENQDGKDVFGERTDKPATGTPESVSGAAAPAQPSSAPAAQGSATTE
ncbi:MAG: hypothetical protein MUC92_04345 [Fimbriimonadaceae bacterium]|nr:hypothetical protein [Fimbriimonadaceae bacterium]